MTNPATPLNEEALLEIERLTSGPYSLVPDIFRRLVVEVRCLRASLTEGVDILRSLYDEQNGPPLLGRKQIPWDAAMARAKAFLAEHES